MKEGKRYETKYFYVSEIGKIKRITGSVNFELEKPYIKIVTIHTDELLIEGIYVDVLTDRSYDHKSKANSDYGYCYSHVGNYVVVDSEPIEHYMDEKKECITIDDVRELVTKLNGSPDNRPKEEILSYIYLANQKLKECNVSAEVKNNIASLLSTLAEEYVNRVKEFKAYFSEENNNPMSESLLRIEYMKKIFEIEEEINSLLILSDKHLDDELTRLNKDLSLNMRK